MVFDCRVVNDTVTKTYSGLETWVASFLSGPNLELGLGLELELGFP